MARRTYVPTLLMIATKMCMYITRGTPVIQRLYPNNIALLAALSAANAACSELAQQLEAARQEGV